MNTSWFIIMISSCDGVNGASSLSLFVIKGTSSSDDDDEESISSNDLLSFRENLGDLFVAIADSILP
jgi:hypothetical protein